MKASKNPWVPWPPGLDHPLWRPRGGQCRDLRLRARHADRHRGPQRREQDHLLQPDLRPAQGHWRRRVAGRARPDRLPVSSARAPGWGGRSSSPTCSPTSRCWRTCAWRCRPRKGKHRRGPEPLEHLGDHRQLTGGRRPSCTRWPCSSAATPRWPACRTATSASSKLRCSWRWSRRCTCSTSPRRHDHDEAPVILNLIRELKDKTKIILLVGTRWTWCASWPTASSC